MASLSTALSDSCLFPLFSTRIYQLSLVFVSTSILFVSDFYSITMLYGFVVFFVQFAILVLLFSDLTRDTSGRIVVEGDLDEYGDYGTSNRSWNIPMQVSTQVAISQFLAIIVAVISQDDALKSIEAVFVADYDAAVVGAAGCRNSTRYRWYFSNFLRWFEGMMTLFIILVVVAQVSGVHEHVITND
jgi:hypothetical protein